MSSGIYLYQHINSGGYVIHLTEGNYNMNDLIARGIRNDDISSIRVVGNYEVKFYQHHNFQGATHTRTTSLSDFRSIGWNDKLSSLRITKLEQEEEKEEEEEKNEEEKEEEEEKNEEEKEEEKKEDETATHIYDNVNSGVVSITAIFGNTAYLGSGFFIKYNNSIYIVTVAHLITTSNRNGRPNTLLASVININGTTTKKPLHCKVIGIAGYADLAVLQVIHEPITTSQKYLSWGNSREIKNGSTCYIIGNPLGYDEISIARGVVRDNKFTYGNIIESMCIAVFTYGGNSGGPIVDSLGRIIGIVSYGFADTEGFTWGCSEHIMKPIVYHIINSQNNYIGKTINTSISSVNAFDLYVLKKLDKELIGYRVDSKSNSLQKNDIILKINNIELGVYELQYPPTTSIYTNSSNIISCTILRTNGPKETVNITLSNISSTEDIYLGGNNAHSNIKLIGPIIKSLPESV